MTAIVKIVLFVCFVCSMSGFGNPPLRTAAQFQIPADLRNSIADLATSVEKLMNFKGKLDLESRAVLLTSLGQTSLVIGSANWTLPLPKSTRIFSDVGGLTSSIEAWWRLSRDIRALQRKLLEEAFDFTQLNELIAHNLFHQILTMEETEVASRDLYLQLKREYDAVPAGEEFGRRVRLIDPLNFEERFWVAVNRAQPPTTIFKKIILDIELFASEHLIQKGGRQIRAAELARFELRWEHLSLASQVTVIVDLLSAYYGQLSTDLSRGQIASRLVRLRLRHDIPNLNAGEVLSPAVGLLEEALFGQSPTIFDHLTRETGLESFLDYLAMERTSTRSDERLGHVKNLEVFFKRLLPQVRVTDPLLAVKWENLSNNWPLASPHYVEEDLPSAPWIKTCQP